MRLTTKGRFAVVAMIHLAKMHHIGPVALNQISAEQNISLSYLEQLFARLRKKHLVESRKGPGGGYIVARDLNHINVADIVQAVDECLDTKQCSSKDGCNEAQTTGNCTTHHLWENLNKHILNYLSSVTLYDLVHQSIQNVTTIKPVINPIGTTNVAIANATSTKHTNNNKPVVKPKAPMQPMINSIFNFAQASQGDL